MVHTVKYFGPPGTGKTTRLMARVMERVKSGEVTLSQCAYLSFSRSAAEVIRERMGATESDVRWFRTIHGACAKLLSLGGAIINNEDYREFSRLTGMVITPTEMDSDDGGEYNVCLHAHHLSLARMVPLAEAVASLPYSPVLGNAAAFVEKWTDYKRTNRKFDFADMLTEYFDHGTPLPCKEVWLDEAQDLSELQWRVFDKMTQDAERIEIAGDDDQAIYYFIGASEYGFLDRKCDEFEVIEQSHRVPEKIGRVATALIKRIKHRQEKVVHWKKIEGSIERQNAEAVSLPWAEFLSEYQDILVLFRHRADAREFSGDLQTVAVAHSLHGLSPFQWKEARIAMIFGKLQAGLTVTAKQGYDLSVAFGNPQQSLMGQKRIGKDHFKIDFDTHGWYHLLGGGRRDINRRYEILEKLIEKEGYEVLVKPPRINISTMHGAKGKEADLVIIMPDCNRTVRERVDEPSEIRLAYVALTRAKKKVILLVPRTDCYMTQFFGG